MPLIMRHDAALKLLSFAMACFTIFLSLVESLKVRGKLECLPTFIRDAVHVRQPTNTHPAAKFVNGSRDALLQGEYSPGHLWCVQLEHQEL